MSILDADLLASLSGKLVAATGMDAFAHAAESYLSRKADAISRTFALRSLELLYHHLPAVRNLPESDRIQHREEILVASLMAGLALNRTGTIALHGMGYSLTIRQQVHHGTANALLFPYVFSHLKQAGYHEEIKELEKIWGETEKMTDFVRELGLPATLGELGFATDHIDELVELCFLGTQRSLKNMKINMTTDDFRKILIQAMS